MSSLMQYMNHFIFWQKPSKNVKCFFNVKKNVILKCMTVPHNDLFVWVMAGHLVQYFQQKMAKRLVGVVDTVPFHNNFVVGMTGNSNNLNYDALA